MKNWKEKRGITLIALVITIIVLLILAAVSIAMLTGENGILTRANISKQQTEIEEAKEQAKLDIEAWLADKLEKGENTKLTDTIIQEILTGKEYVAEAKSTSFTTKKNQYDIPYADLYNLSDGNLKQGIEPQVEINLYQEDGSALEEGVIYDKVIITVDVKNASELGKIDAITVTDASENVINKESTVIGIGTESYKVTESGIYTINVKATTNGIQRETSTERLIKVSPEAWRVTSTTDKEWYNYGNAVISGPKLTGEMQPIKYVGETQTGNKWANAITADGSMWVWIPRYAYKITEGYHSNITGKIEVAFVKANDNSDIFLNGETGEITRDPRAEGAGTTKWLVHPAFTANATNGGGFGELEGLWVGKFEATGTETNLSVKPGVASLCNMTINSQYQLAKNSKFGETATINSHMAKNSEWGAAVYLGHSQYGTNRQKISRNGTGLISGGNSSKTEIYTTNKTQSTTHNATGVYDLNGGAYESVASYVNNGGANLKTNGGETKGDLYGETEERATSTAYKMVYEGVGTQSTDYGIAKKYKGDAIYETSNDFDDGVGSWFQSSAYMPNTGNPFFQRGAPYTHGSYNSAFVFNMNNGSANSYYSFRMVLAF